MGLIGNGAGLYDHNNYLDITDQGSVTGFDGQGVTDIGQINSGDSIDIVLDTAGIHFTLPTGQTFMGHYKNGWYMNSIQGNIQFRIAKAQGIPPALVVQKTPNI